MSTETDDRSRARLAYRMLVQRDPDEEEADWIVAYVRAGGGAADGGRWSRAVQALVASTEFRFLD